MRRADKEVKDLDQLEEILRACTAVRIGVRDERGMFIVPMSYGYALEGEKLTLFVHSAPEGRKVSAFRAGGEADTAIPTAASWAAGPSGNSPLWRRSGRPSTPSWST